MGAVTSCTGLGGWTGTAQCTLSVKDGTRPAVDLSGFDLAVVKGKTRAHMHSALEQLGAAGGADTGLAGIWRIEPGVPQGLEDSLPFSDRHLVGFASKFDLGRCGDTCDAIIGHYIRSRADDLRSEGLDTDALLERRADPGHGQRLLQRFGEIVRDETNR